MQTSSTRRGAIEVPFGSPGVVALKVGINRHRRLTRIVRSKSLLRNRNPLPKFVDGKTERVGDDFHRIQRRVCPPVLQPAQVSLVKPGVHAKRSLAQTCFQAKLPDTSSESLRERLLFHVRHCVTYAQITYRLIHNPCIDML
jgi:hypothetical protein